MKLNEAQNLFKEALFDENIASKAKTHLKPAGHLNIEEALQKYRSCFDQRLWAELLKTYPKTLTILTEQEAQNIFTQYKTENPPTTFHISEFSRNFADFLHQHSTYKKYPFIFDLARLEWTYSELEKVSTPDPLPVENIQEILLAEDFKVHFCEALEVFQSPYSVYDLWINPYSVREQAVTYLKPETLLLHKKGSRRIVEKISSHEGQILLALLEGESISEALIHFMPQMAPNKITDFFQLLMKAGVIEDLIIIHG